MPIMSLAVRSETLSPRDLTTLADRTVKRRLENIQGVARARLVGSSRREVTVEIDPARLSALGMGVDEVVGGLASENVNTPLGRLTQGRTEMPLRISGKPTRRSTGFASMVISRRGDQPIRLSDVATIRDGVEEQRSLALINGEPAVAIDITKQTAANVGRGRGRRPRGRRRAEPGHAWGRDPGRARRLQVHPRGGGGREDDAGPRRACSRSSSCSSS